MTTGMKAPAVHRSDPVTSYEAAALMDWSGSRFTHAQRVLRFVGALPGRTASEIADFYDNLDVVEVRRRLHDLHVAGLVRQGEPRLAVGRRVREVTWWPVDRQVELF